MFFFVTYHSFTSLNKMTKENLLILRIFLRFIGHWLLFDLEGWGPARSTCLRHATHDWTSLWLSTQMNWSGAWLNNDLMTTLSHRTDDDNLFCWTNRSHVIIIQLNASGTLIQHISHLWNSGGLQDSMHQIWLVLKNSRASFSTFKKIFEFLIY